MTLAAILDHDDKERQNWTSCKQITIDFVNLRESFLGLRINEL